MDDITAPDSTNEPTMSAASALDDGVPQWVKETGLEAAHHAAKPGTTVTNPPPATSPAKPATQAAPAATQAQPGPGAQATTTQPEPAASTPPVIPPGLDPKAFVEAVRAVVPASAAPQSDQAADDVRLAQQLGIVTVTPEMYKSIIGVDAQPEQVTALNTLVQSIAKQAVTVSSVILQNSIKSLRDELTPYTGAVRAQQAEQHQTKFFTAHPDLAPYKGLVEQQYTVLKASGKTFASPEEAYKALADSTRTMLTSLGIVPKAPAAGNGTQPNRTAPPPQTTRQMAPTSMGGRSGGTPATKPGTHQSVWG